MTSTAEYNSDPRIAEILDIIFKYAAGDLKARGNISKYNDALDGVMSGINILGEELEASVSQSRQASESRKQALDYAKTLIRSSPDGILAVDRALRITEWNPLMEQIFGTTREQAIGRVLDTIPLMQETGEAARIRAGLDGMSLQRKEIKFRLPGADKESVFEFHMAPLRDGADRIQGAVLRVLDITEREWVEDQLRLASLYARNLIEASLDPMTTISAAGKIMDLNNAAAQATGVPRDLLLGSDFSQYFTDPGKARAAYQEAFTKGIVRNLPLTLVHESGKLTDVLYNASVFHDERGEVAGVLTVARDITEHKRAEQAEEMSRHDGLTNLYNHSTFNALLEEEAMRTLRFNRQVSLLMLDIDHFKDVNDTYGHRAGDIALKSLSDLLMDESRAVDRVCRYGGEEFAVILPETDAGAAMQIAERLRAAINQQPFDIGGGKTISITVSIGVATYPQQVDSSAAFINAADGALYGAKHAGRNRVRLYEAGMLRQDS